mgnify:CR=1 FL=1
MSKKRADAIENPATPLARWMSKNGRSIHQLSHEARIAWLTARTYVLGTNRRPSQEVARSIERWTGGAVTVADVMCAGPNSEEAA